MIKEIDLFGVFLPPLLLYAAIAAVLWQPVRLILERIGFYRFVWHPALFNVAAYMAVLSAVVVFFL